MKKAAKRKPAPPPKRTRDRARTEAELRAAVESLLVEKGFAALTPSAIGARAGVDKMLIYRYFGDVAGLVRAIAYAPDFFPTFEDVCGDKTRDEVLAMPIGARAAHILSNNARALLARPVVLELMVWELVERNALTAVTEEARETVGLRITKELFPDAGDQHQLLAIAAVLAAGVTYLAIRRRKIRWFNGVDLRSDEGWRDISTAIAAMTSGLG